MTSDQEYVINQIAIEAYQNAKSKGFHDKDGDVVADYARWSANLHGEVSELWEAARKGELNKPCDKASFMEDQLGESLTCEEEELADIIIRAFDTSVARGISIGRAIRVKMAYNATRSHMHGKLA